MVTFRFPDRPYMLCPNPKVCKSFEVWLVKDNMYLRSKRTIFNYLKFKNKITAKRSYFVT